MSECSDLVNVRVTHKKARVPLIEALAFKDKVGALKEIMSLEGVKECVLLQTCNRIELYLAGDDGERIAMSAGAYLSRRAGAMEEEASTAIEYSLNRDVFEHALRVACGLESMVVGEDQILAQVWDAYLEAESAKTAGPVFRKLFRKAVNVGRQVRAKTGISKGAISVGSVAVELACSLLGDFEGKKILVIGAGEIGTLVAKALARRELAAIFIANRTYERALQLAEKLGGTAIKFDRMAEKLQDADVVICATSAPHYLLTKELVSSALAQRSNKNDLIIIDISNPRNVEKSVQEIRSVSLYNLDHLQEISDKNKEERRRCIEEAEAILDPEIALLEKDLKALSVREIISSMLSQAEAVRQREVATALSMLGDVDEKERRVIEDLTRILLKQTFVPIVEKLRTFAMNDDKQVVEIAAKLLMAEENVSIQKSSEAYDN